MRSFPCLTTYFVNAETFGAFTDSLPNLTTLKLYRFDPSHMLHLYKCLNLQTLFLCAHSYPEFVKIPSLFDMANFSKLSLYRLHISKASISAFEGLSSLRILKFNQCKIVCDWFELGISLSRCPLERLIIYKIECKATHVEELLKSIQLQYLRIYLASGHGWRAARALFKSFSSTFNSVRSNPRSFLIQHFGHAHNLNGVLVFG